MKWLHLETKKHSSLTKRQFLVLKYRTSGLSQLQTARKLTTSRANIYMIELRAEKEIEKARETLWAYESMLSERVVRVKQGTRLQDIPQLC